MNKSDKKFDEEALRHKIREQLHRDHKRRQEVKKETETPAEILSRRDEDESYYLEIYIRRQLQEQVYSKYPEFVKCGNHLDQIKWLTPLEMEEEFEFFPLEYTFWERLKIKLTGRYKVKLPKTAEIQKMIAEFREEIENDARERVQAYRNHVKENQKNISDDIEKRIFEEEQDRFYSKQKGYYKYKNHLNETAWMTKEEFEDQDEYIDRVYTPREKMFRSILYITGIIVMFFGVYFISDYLGSDSQIGYLVVDTGDHKGSLYIDQDLAVGFTPGKPYPIAEGEHIVTVISSGFVTDPGFMKVKINVADTSRISFNVKAIEGNKGYVRLKVPFPDAGIYVDGEFKGTIQEGNLMALSEGDHTITVEKDNYFSMPPVHTFALKSGDTLDLRFSMTPRRTGENDKPFNASINLGLISVNANVRGAQIILNSQQTGFQTDYILQKIPFGQHVIRVEKEGYTVYPKEQIIRLSQDNRQVKVDFTLTSTTKNVVLTVHPKTATIYINGNEAGVGRFEGALPLGEHKITFSDVDHYKNPGTKTITVQNDGPARFEFKYGSDVDFTASPGYIEPAGSNVRISEGYILNGVTFQESSSNKPDVVINEKNGRKVWNMGYAFPYKNPPGMDALLMRFQAPNDLFLLDDINLKLWIYNTDDNYPLVLSGKSQYRVILNNAVVTENRVPRYSINQIAENRFEQINISKFIKPGFNSLIISTGNDNTRFLQLWKVTVE